MGACDIPLLDTVCGSAGLVLSGADQAVTDGIGMWLTKSAADVAASATDLAAKAIDSTTAIDLNAPWFRDNYELLLPIGLVLTVGTFCLQLVMAAWRRDERALAQAVIGTMTGVLFSFCAVAFTSVAATVVDALSDGLFQAAHTSIAAVLRRLIRVDQLSNMSSLGWGVPTLAGIGMALGGFLYWGVMVARKVGVLILVALAVFAGAGGGWEVAKRWRRGWIEATATLVVSKLLMTVVFLIGVSAMGKSDSHDGLSALSDAMAGLVIMVLVLLCPYATHKFVRWASDGGGHDDLHRSGVAGFTAAAGAARTAASLALQVHTGTAAPQGPSRVPGAGPDGVASGIAPAGLHLSKEGIDSAPQPKTTFRYGEDDNAPGDKGSPLVQRPGIPPLITRPASEGSPDRQTDSAAPPPGSTAAGAGHASTPPSDLSEPPATGGQAGDGLPSRPPAGS